MALITMEDIESISPVFKGKFGNKLFLCVFFDRNSNWFYFLGLVNWRLRTLRLPREILNKEGKTVRVGIGEVISVDEQMRVPEADFASMLRSSVYGIVESNNSK